MPATNYVLPLIVVLFLFSCKENSPVNPEIRMESEPIEEDVTTITYEESFADFPNPERGFYRYSETRASNYQPLSESQLRAQRGLTGGNYQSYNTLTFRYFVLDEFTDSPISEEILELIDKDFVIARAAGVKLIPRFCYTTTAKSGDCPEEFICPPYGDAPKAIVLQHIQQIAPIINKHEDVILCIQMGFIGTWGENFYTDYFGDISPNGPTSSVQDEHWTDRVEVVDALLDNFSENIIIQVRYPQLKQKAVYGIDALASSPTMTAAEAFTRLNKARIGFHNDCLFAGPNDFGTYTDYGTSSSPNRTDLINLKPYFQSDGQYVLVGGETCSDGYSPQNNCSPEGMADTELRALHYTYLNADYNNDVNDDWVEGGCMDSILLHLGYRYVLTEGTFQKELSADGTFDFQLSLKNVGYASITKERPVNLVLKHTASGTTYSYPLDTDIRWWFSKVNIEARIQLEAAMAAGEYECYLYLPDNYDAIKDRSEYAIQLGNIGVWDEANGYNDLGFVLSLP